MGRPRMTTKRGYDFYEVASALQKAIRRDDATIAGYFALELFASGFGEYAWKRLLTISAEDCYSDTITTEIYNLYRSYRLIREGTGKEMKGRIFISKAVLILCRDPKSRDADHLSNYVYDREMVGNKDIATYLKEIDDAGTPDIPDYTYDVHTLKGKIMGKTKEQFFTEEYNALVHRQKGLFDDVINR